MEHFTGIVRTRSRNLVDAKKTFQCTTRPSHMADFFGSFEISEARDRWSLAQHLNGESKARSPNRTSGRHLKFWTAWLLGITHQLPMRHFYLMKSGTLSSLAILLESTCSSGDSQHQFPRCQCHHDLQSFRLPAGLGCSFSKRPVLCSYQYLCLHSP